MKKYIGFIFFFIFISTQLQGQSIVSLKQKNIVGRWVEDKAIIGNDSTSAIAYPDTYIFRDNMLFHKGEAAEGIILFNITGKYKIEGNSIIIYYRDYTKRQVQKQDALKLIFEVLSISENEMKILVKDYDFENEIILKKLQ
ncbi:MAG: lipocalin family protein [Dysgonomonas sp.]|nr:lipocalin family protein [Dysgonomonas sp.]